MQQIKHILIKIKILYSFQTNKYVRSYWCRVDSRFSRTTAVILILQCVLCKLFNAAYLLTYIFMHVYIYILTKLLRTSEVEGVRIQEKKFEKISHSVISIEGSTYVIQRDSSEAGSRVAKFIIKILHLKREKNRLHWTSLFPSSRHYKCCSKNWPNHFVRCNIGWSITIAHFFLMRSTKIFELIRRWCCGRARGEFTTPIFIIWRAF